jgi:DnaJ-class molecular chaperone
MLNALRDLDMNTNSSFSLRDVTIAYRAAAVRHHPDKGGQVSVFRQVKAAYDFLRGLFRCD